MYLCRVVIVLTKPVIVDPGGVCTTPHPYRFSPFKEPVFPKKAQKTVSISLCKAVDQITVLLMETAVATHNDTVHHWLLCTMRMDYRIA